MPLDGLEIRVSLQRLLLGLVVVIVPLSVVMLTLLAVYFFLHRRQQAPKIGTLHTQGPSSKKMSASA